MEIVADLQTEIKLLIKNTVFRVSEWIKFQKQVDEMIEAGLKELKNEAFKETAKRALKRFADIEFEKLVKAFDFESAINSRIKRCIDRNKRVTRTD